MNKKFKLVSMLSLAGLLLASNAVVASAAEDKTPVGDLDYAKSDVKVKIQIPNINDKETLAFDEVPEAFDFGLIKADKTINQVNSSIQLVDTKVSVYKDYARNDTWEVKAVASDLTDGQNKYELSSFKLNDKAITGTGANPIILKSQDNNNGIGTYSYDINSAAIDFKLPSQKKEGITELKGNVTYALSVTKAAE